MPSKPGMPQTTTTLSFTAFSSVLPSVIARYLFNFLFATITLYLQVAKAHLDQGVLPGRPGVHATEAV